MSMSSTPPYRRKLRLKSVAATKWQSWGLNPGAGVLNPCALLSPALQNETGHLCARLGIIQVLRKRISYARDGGMSCDKFSQSTVTCSHVCNGGSGL